MSQHEGSALESLDGVKRSIEIQGDNHLNMINEVIERVECMKLKTQNKADISDFLKQYCTSVTYVTYTVYWFT